MALNNFIMRWWRVLKLKTHQIFRGISTSPAFANIPNVWKSRRVLCSSLFSMGLLMMSVAMLLMGTHYRSVAYRKTQVIAKQRIILDQMIQSHKTFEAMEKDFGQPFSSLFTKIHLPITPLEEMLDILKMKNRLTEAEWNVKKIINQDDHSIIKLELNLKAIRDQNLIWFLKAFESTIPGALSYQKVEIKRLGNIMTRQEFSKFLEEQKRNHTVTPSFEAVVECEINLSTEWLQAFLKRDLSLDK